MRLALATGLILMAAAIEGAGAQGTKDPANYGAVSNAKPQIPSGQSRPTSVQNVPYNALPSGMAVQRVYRDGKLVTIVR